MAVSTNMIGIKCERIEVNPKWLKILVEEKTPGVVCCWNIFGDDNLCYVPSARITCEISDLYWAVPNNEQ